MDDDIKRILAVIEGDIDGQNDWQACGSEVAGSLRNCLDQLQGASTASASGLKEAGEKLQQLLLQAHHHLQSVHHSKVERKWRRLFTDASILKGIIALHSDAAGQEEEKEALLLEAVRDLDIAIIQCGAPGRDRLDSIHREIRLLQRAMPRYLENQVNHDSASAFSETEERWEQSDAFCLASMDMQEEEQLPPFEEYLRERHRSPFVVRGYASDWPALATEDGNHHNNNTRSWRCKHYLEKVAGRGRVVPVEVGRQYTDANWTQEIISWPDFLRESGWKTDANALSCRPNSRHEHDHDDDRRVLYLAQHNLFRQFPDLEADISVPDLVYSCPPAPDHFTGYRPPFDEEDGLETCIINAWIGPKGTTTPAHYDPYYNAYVQVVGHKLVWIAPPDIFDKSGVPSSTLLSDGNTSTVPIFDSAKSLDPDPILSKVKEGSSRVILSPGDLLVLPPGWFHGMRSLTRSFSVSMWY